MASNPRFLQLYQNKTRLQGYEDLPGGLMQKLAQNYVTKPQYLYRWLVESDNLFIYVFSKFQKKIPEKYTNKLSSFF